MSPRDWPRKKIVRREYLGRSYHSRGGLYVILLECGHHNFINASKVAQKSLHCFDCTQAHEDPRAFEDLLRELNVVTE